MKLYQDIKQRIQEQGKQTYAAYSHVGLFPLSFLSGIAKEHEKLEVK
jgi:hypothetical protein